jgi:hypothetical protein
MSVLSGLFKAVRATNQPSHERAERALQGGAYHQPTLSYSMFQTLIIRRTYKDRVLHHISRHSNHEPLVSMPLVEHVLHGWCQVRNDKLAMFMGRDFTKESNKTAALKNGFALLGQLRYKLAGAFFLLGGSVHDCTAALTRSKTPDTNLALLVCRLTASVAAATAANAANAAVDFTAIDSSSVGSTAGEEFGGAGGRPFCFIWFHLVSFGFVWFCFVSFLFHFCFIFVSFCFILFHFVSFLFHFVQVGGGRGSTGPSVWTWAPAAAPWWRPRCYRGRGRSATHGSRSRFWPSSVATAKPSRWR